MPLSSHTAAHDDAAGLVATPDAVLDGLRRIEARIARLGADGAALAAAIGAVGARVLAAAAQVRAAEHAGDPRAGDLRRQLASAAATARTFAGDALRALERTTAILHAQHDAFGTTGAPDVHH